MKVAMTCWAVAFAAMGWLAGRSQPQRMTVEQLEIARKGEASMMTLCAEKGGALVLRMKDETGEVVLQLTHGEASLTLANGEKRWVLRGDGTEARK